MTKIGIASDHAGYEMKEFLVGYLSAMGYDVHDFGPGSPESVDYADYAHPLAEPQRAMPHSNSPFSTASASGCA